MNEQKFNIKFGLSNLGGEDRYFEGKLKEQGMVLTLYSHNSLYSIDESVKIHQKLGQMIAFAKKEQAKK